MLCEIQEEKKS